MASPLTLHICCSSAPSHTTAHNFVATILLVHWNHCLHKRASMPRSGWWDLMWWWAFELTAGLLGAVYAQWIDMMLHNFIARKGVTGVVSQGHILVSQEAFRICGQYVMKVAMPVGEELNECWFILCHKCSHWGLPKPILG